MPVGLSKGGVASVPVSLGKGGVVSVRNITSKQVWRHFGYCVAELLFSARLVQRTHFSLSPSHLDTRSEEEIEKKVELLASVATALARYDFPVPGGPKSRIPLHGVRLPESRENQKVHCNMSYFIMQIS